MNINRIGDIAADEWAALSRLLDEVLELEDTERQAWLLRLSVQAPRMAERVARALAVRTEERFCDFLAEPLPLVEPMQPGTSFVGRIVGPYQIEAQIGRGGMGSVWRARRIDGRYEGKVAVKFLHAAWVGQAAEERFRTEGIILGRLDHPNIARLLDAGILDGNQPYIVLEYVEGEPIDIHCERLRLSLEERSRLFLEVLAAVGQAHAHLIVHRDLKPANILVTHDGSVKLLDFGIAKLLDDDRGALHATTVGVMTPLYAAPEQLLGRPALTATDVYALGLVYYLLLTGAHPLAREFQSNAEIFNAVLTKDPLPASTLAGTGPIRPQALAGDLDNILGKALKKNPAERYDSVALFADDIQRFLAHQPVKARPDTLRYRTSKFVRRNRGSVITAAATALALVLAAAAAVWEAHTARQERDVALTAERRADSVGEFLTVLVGNIGNSVSPQTIRPQFDHARELVEKQLYDDPRVKANLLRYLAGRYAEFGDSSLAVTLLEEAREVLRNVDEPVDSAQLDCSIANFDDDLGRAEEADRHIRRAVSVLSSLGNSVRPEVRADCRVVESYVATSRGENRRSISAARIALAEIENAGVHLGLQHDTVVNALARAEARAGFNGIAVALLRDLRRSDVAQGRDRTLGGWIHGFNEARDLLAGGRTAEAERLGRDLLVSSRQFSNNSNNFHGISLMEGESLFALGRVEESIPLLTEAVASDTGPDATLESTLALIEAQLRSGDRSGAHRELDLQRDRLTGAIERRSSEAAEVLRVRALDSLETGDPQSAEALLAQAAGLAMDADGLPTAAWRRIAALRAEVALKRGATGDACRYAEAAVGRAREEAVDPTSSAWTGEALLLRSRCNAAAGRIEHARADARLASLQLEPNLGHDHPLTRQARELGDGI
jgi:serine/threonine-protein kinase